MILLGAYLEKTGIVSIEEALAHFNDIFEGKKPSIIEKNREAFLAGVEYARNNW